MCKHIPIDLYISICFYIALNIPITCIEVCRVNKNAQQQWFNV